jgi:hypothetical protein
MTQPGARHRSQKATFGFLAKVLAAHPYDVAQVPPARWGQADLSQRRLTGYEFWNGRARVSGKSTSNPFDRPSWKDQAKLQ